MVIMNADENCQFSHETRWLDVIVALDVNREHTAASEEVVFFLTSLRILWEQFLPPPLLSDTNQVASSLITSINVKNGEEMNPAASRQ